MYQALYRKYRPKNFEDVVGQKYVTTTLKNAIKNNKVSHAYMFFGPRGIGKTTIAKIFARSINCEHPVEGNPCEKCPSCLKSIESKTMDIIEIDAASNNGVDEIREIKNKVNIVPSDLKYKVYIIDEVHMLTSGAFNALLKTLEEPPKHVIFILATTDPQKVSETIISRCQCFSFKRISVDDIIENLKKICEKESIQIEEEVLELIAQASNGGLRDSLSTLDKISSYKQEKITVNDFLEINDMISLVEIEKLTNNILSGNTKQVILDINKYNKNGKNLIEIINQLLYYLRDELVSYYLDQKKMPQNVEKYELLANILNENMFDIKKSADPKIFIELILLKFINSTNKITDDTRKNYEESQKIISREIISPENSQNISQKITNNDDENYPKTNYEEIMNVRLNNALALGNKQEKKLCEEKIEKLNEFVFDQKIGYLVSEILNSTIRVVSKDIIILSYAYDSVVNQNINEIDKMTSILKEYADIDQKIGIISDETWEKEKKKYIESVKKGKKYDIIEEPKLIKQEKKENDIDSPLIDFGDIVEYE